MAEVDNLFDEFVSRLGPLGQIEHILRNMFPEEGIAVLEQPGAVDSLGFATTARCYRIYEVTVHTRDTTGTKPTELQFMSTVDSSANEDEVANSEGRRDDIGSLVVRGDGMLAPKTYSVLDVFVDFVQGLL